jgi:hypothetical protein
MNKFRSFIFLSLVVFGAKSFAMDLPATLEFEKLFNHESYSWFVKQCEDTVFVTRLICGFGEEGLVCLSNPRVYRDFVKLITTHNQVFCDHETTAAFCNRIQELSTLEETSHKDTRPSQQQAQAFLDSLTLLFQVLEQKATKDQDAKYSCLQQCRLFLEFLCKLCSGPAVKFLIEQKIAPTAHRTDEF